MPDTIGGLEREHDQRLVELQSLFELSKTLNSSFNLQTVLNTLLFTPMGRMLIAHGAILLHSEKDQFKIQIVKGLSRDLLGKSISLQNDWDQPVHIDELQDAAGKALLQKHGIRLVSPILSNNKCLGLILLGKKLGDRPFKADELEYLSSMANLAAPAIENSSYIKELQEVNRQLDKKIQELNTLFDIGKELNATLERDKIANTLAYAIMGEMMVQKCLIFLENEQGVCMPQVIKGFRRPNEVALIADADLQECLLACTNAQLAEEVENEQVRQEMQKSGLALLVPMITQDKVKGCILVGGRLNATPFQHEDLEFLATLGNSAMISLENARLLQETIIKERLEEELSIARDIQQGLLPKSPPKVDGYDFAGLNIPSLQVGGDYYDYFKIDENRIALAIGDVSGKGVGASLLMSNLQASLHAMIHAKWSLSEVVFRINNIIHQNTPFDKFITFFLAIVDCKSGEMTYVNAGHNPPYIYHPDGTLKTLEVGGLILGMMPNMPYEQETIKLTKGDWVVSFTDGVSEAMNEDEEEYEEYRIESYIQTAEKRDAAQFTDGLKEDVRRFCGNAPQSDDITMLVFRITG